MRSYYYITHAHDDGPFEERTAGRAGPLHVLFGDVLVTEVVSLHLESYFRSDHPWRQRDYVLEQVARVAHGFLPTTAALLVRIVILVVDLVWREGEGDDVLDLAPGLGVARVVADQLQDRLEAALGAPVFLDSDDLSDLAVLLQHVVESDVLLMVLSKSYFERPW